MTERAWKLGEDLYPEDNILDGIDFRELLTTVRCNCREITPEAVSREFWNIVSIHMEDAAFLLERNLEEIVKIIRKERANDDVQ